MRAKSSRSAAAGIALDARDLVEDHRPPRGQGIGRPARIAGTREMQERSHHRRTDRPRRRNHHRCRRPEECRPCAARGRIIELVDEGGDTGAGPFLRLDHLPAPAAPGRGRGEEYLLGRIGGVEPAIFGDHPFGMGVDAQLGRHPRGEIVPVQPDELRMVRRDRSRASRPACCRAAAGYALPTAGWRPARKGGGLSHFMSSTGPI